jgi:hypothetical protein
VKICKRISSLKAANKHIKEKLHRQHLRNTTLPLKDAAARQPLQQRQRNPTEEQDKACLRCCNSNTGNGNSDKKKTIAREISGISGRLVMNVETIGDCGDVLIPVYSQQRRNTD